MTDTSTVRQPLPHSAKATYDALLDRLDEQQEALKGQLDEFHATWRAIRNCRYYREVLMPDERQNESGASEAS